MRKEFKSFLHTNMAAGTSCKKKKQSISKDIRIDIRLSDVIDFCDASSSDFWREINLTMSYDMGEIQQYNKYEYAILPFHTNIRH